MECLPCAPWGSSLTGGAKRGAPESQGGSRARTRGASPRTVPVAASAAVSGTRGLPSRAPGASAPRDAPPAPGRLAAALAPGPGPFPGKAAPGSAPWGAAGAGAGSLRGSSCLSASSSQNCGLRRRWAKRHPQSRARSGERPGREGVPRSSPEPHASAPCTPRGKFPGRRRGPAAVSRHESNGGSLQ